MRILFVSEYFPPKVMGGGEINLAQVAKGLAETGVEVAVLTSLFPGLAREETMEGVRIYRRLKSGATPQSLVENIRRLIHFPRSVVAEVQRLDTELRPEIIHLLGTSLIAAPKLRSLKKRLLATIESYPALCPKGDRLFHGKKECTTICSLRKFIACQQHSSEFGKMKNRWYLKYNPFFWAVTYQYYRRLRKALQACQLIAISSYVQRVLLQHGQQSVVIPNAFEATPFLKARTNKKDGASPRTTATKKPMILYVGALLHSKGPQILLEAVRGLNCRCEFYGAGILKEELQQKIKAYHLDAEIFPPQPYEKMPEIYAKADVVVFPSLWPEPFGRIPLEAMAAGKPIVASSTGAIPETVGARGVLVKPGDSKDLQGALSRVLREKNTIQKREVGYSNLSIIQKIKELYEQGGESHRRAAPALNAP